MLSSRALQPAAVPLHSVHDVHAAHQDDREPHSSVNMQTSAPRSQADHNTSGPPSQIKASLYIPLTGYRLLTIMLIFSIGTAKALLSAQGKLTAPTALEWVAGVVCALR